jgi:hypothetical protein
MGVNTGPQASRCWPILHRAAVCAGRILTASILVAVSLWAMAGLELITGHSRPVHRAWRPREPTAVPSPTGWAAALQLPAGAWTIAALPWRLELQRLPRAIAEAEVLKPPPLEVLAVPDAADQRSEILALIQALAPERRAEAGYIVYSLPVAGGRAAVFTAETSGGEQVRYARAAYAAPGGDFFLVEAAPRPGPPSGQWECPSGLLPLPDNSRRLATRQDERGGLIAELTMTDADVAALRARWEREGYHIEMMMGTGKVLQGVTCRRDRQVVHVWLWTRAAGAGQTLLLQVRLPMEVTG